MSDQIKQDLETIAQLIELSADSDYCPELFTPAMHEACKRLAQHSRCLICIEKTGLECS